MYFILLDVDSQLMIVFFLYRNKNAMRDLANNLSHQVLCFPMQESSGPP